jgi:hypothetical protein
MSTYYDIMINGETKFSRLSEEEFFDAMEDLAEGFYNERGVDPTTITHISYQD